MKLKLITFVFFCISFIHCNSQNQTSDKLDLTWDTVGISNNSLYLIKTTYETKSEEEMTIWIKVVNAPKKAKDRITKVATLDKILYGFDCNGRKIKVIAYVHYSLNGKVLKNRTIEEWEQKWINIVPETIGEMLFTKACSME